MSTQLDCLNILQKMLADINHQLTHEEYLKMCLSLYLRASENREQCFETDFFQEVFYPRMEPREHANFFKFKQLIYLSDMYGELPNTFMYHKIHKSLSFKSLPYTNLILYLKMLNPDIFESGDFNLLNIEYQTPIKLFRLNISTIYSNGTFVFHKYEFKTSDLGALKSNPEVAKFLNYLKENPDYDSAKTPGLFNNPIVFLTSDHPLPKNPTLASDYLEQGFTINKAFFTKMPNILLSRYLTQDAENVKKLIGPTLYDFAQAYALGVQTFGMLSVLE